MTAFLAQNTRSAVEHNATGDVDISQPTVEPLVSEYQFERMMTDLDPATRRRVAAFLGEVLSQMQGISETQSTDERSHIKAQSQLSMEAAQARREQFAQYFADTSARINSFAGNNYINYPAIAQLDAEHVRETKLLDER